jgi:hypothetical protein
MVQTEAQRRAKAKYYAKIKDNEEYKEKMKQNQKNYYELNKEKHSETCKKYYANHKDKLQSESKQKRDQAKIKYVVSKLQEINVEDLAKILIHSKKTKLIDI